MGISICILVYLSISSIYKPLIIIPMQVEEKKIFLSLPSAGIIGLLPWTWDFDGLQPAVGHQECWSKQGSGTYLQSAAIQMWEPELPCLGPMTSGGKIEWRNRRCLSSQAARACHPHWVFVEGEVQHIGLLKHKPSMNTHTHTQITGVRF